MPRCFLAKKSSSSTSPLTSSSSSCTNSSSEIEEGNNHLDDHLTPLTEKWDDTITVKSEIEDVEDEEAISSDGNSSSNSGEDHFLPPSRLIHRSTVGSISAAQAVQSIKEPLKVGTPCVETSVKSSTSIYHQNYDSNNENFIPSHIKNDDAQSNVPELPVKKEKSISQLTSSTSTIATQTYSNPEDESEEEDIKPNVAILSRKPNSLNNIGNNKQKEEVNLNLNNSSKKSFSTKCVLSNAPKFKDENLSESIKISNSTDLNGNDERTKPSYLEQKEKLEKNLLNQTLRFCSRKHSKKHQKRKKKLLQSKLSVSVALAANDGSQAEANAENDSNCLGRTFQHPLKLNKSFATLTVVHPVQQQTPSLPPKTQQQSPEQSLHVNPFPINTVTKVSSNNFKLLPQQPVAITTSAPVFPISSPATKPITGLSFPATAVTAGGATIHPISAPTSIDCNELTGLSSNINNTTSTVQTSTSSLGAQPSSMSPTVATAQTSNISPDSKPGLKNTLSITLPQANLAPLVTTIKIEPTTIGDNCTTPIPPEILANIQPHPPTSSSISVASNSSDASSTTLPTQRVRTKEETDAAHDLLSLSRSLPPIKPLNDLSNGVGAVSNPVNTSSFQKYSNPTRLATTTIHPIHPPTPPTPDDQSTLDQTQKTTPPQLTLIYITSPNNNNNCNNNINSNNTLSISNNYPQTEIKPKINQPSFVGSSFLPEYPLTPPEQPTDCNAGSPSLTSNGPFGQLRASNFPAIQRGLKIEPSTSPTPYDDGTNTTINLVDPTINSALPLLPTEPALTIVDGRTKKSKNGMPIFNRDKSKYTCSECGKNYATSSNLSRHKQTHRSLDSNNAKKCHVCGKMYVSMPALSMHILTHNLSHKCTVCNKAFSRPWLLQGHLRSHTGQKPYLCTVCKKSFADRSNLRAHMQTHSPSKNFQCSRCQKTFALKSYLNKHYESSCVRGASSNNTTTTQSHPSEHQFSGSERQMNPNLPSIAIQQQVSTSINSTGGNSIHLGNLAVPTIS